jgi:hypothetical protein
VAGSSANQLRFHPGWSNNRWVGAGSAAFWGLLLLRRSVVPGCSAGALQKYGARASSREGAVLLTRLPLLRVPLLLPLGGFALEVLQLRGGRRRASS